jgi:hypothetical protein
MFALADTSPVQGLRREVFSIKTLAEIRFFKETSYKGRGNETDRKPHLPQVLVIAGGAVRGVPRGCTTLFFSTCYIFSFSSFFAPPDAKLQSPHYH